MVNPLVFLKGGENCGYTVFAYSRSNRRRECYLALRLQVA